MTEQVLRNYARAGVTALVVLALFLIGTIGIESVPPLWWDEGWTLCVARNWVVLGHYGCLLIGQPAPPILSGHFPVVAPVALSFYLFGIGVWQARIVGLLFALGALSLLYFLTSRLFSHSVAIGTITILLLCPVEWELHPLIIGRQVLGEMPMLFYLLAGYACFLHTSENTRLFLPLASVSWGIALMSKAQVWPFWAISLAIPLVVSLFMRDWRFARLLTFGFVGSLASFYLLEWTHILLLRGHTVPSPPSVGLREAVAIVLSLSVRQKALVFVLLSCLPTLCGLGWATAQWIVTPARYRVDTMPELVRLMLLVFCGSWLAWFTLLSVGWHRYAFPALFLATPFTASLLEHLYSRVRRSIAGDSTSPGSTRSMPLAQRVSVIVATVLVCIMGLATIQAGYKFARTPGDQSVQQLVQFVNGATAPSARVETYESELLFLLERPYHYPPAQLNVDFIRKNVHHEPISVDYDPLTADPDYLIVGRWAQWLGLYRRVLRNGTFRLVKTVGRYQVYERVR